MLTVFEDGVDYSEAIRLVGALWGAIFLLSMLGLWWPERMSVVLLLQLIYKASWLLIVALPIYLAGGNYPRGMAVTFLIWVLVLPFVIPWGYIFGPR